MFCTSHDGWTKQGDDYIRRHVRYAKRRMGRNRVNSGTKEEEERETHSSPSSFGSDEKRRTGLLGSLGGGGCDGEVQGVWGVRYSPGNRVWRKLRRMGFQLWVRPEP